MRPLWAPSTRALRPLVNVLVRLSSRETNVFHFPMTFGSLSESRRPDCLRTANRRAELPGPVLGTGGVRRRRQGPCLARRGYVRVGLLSLSLVLPQRHVFPPIPRLCSGSPWSLARPRLTVRSLGVWCAPRGVWCLVPRRPGRARSPVSAIPRGRWVGVGSVVPLLVPLGFPSVWVP